MTLSVRLPDRVEQDLSDYCVKRKISKSEAVKEALDQFLHGEAKKPTAFELGKDLFGADVTHRGNIARNTKRLLRERYRGKAHR